LERREEKVSARRGTVAFYRQTPSADVKPNGEASTASAEQRISALIAGIIMSMSDLSTQILGDAIRRRAIGRYMHPHFKLASPDQNARCVVRARFQFYRAKEFLWLKRPTS
jgi:hypothetical protein